MNDAPSSDKSSRLGAIISSILALSVVGAVTFLAADNVVSGEVVVSLFSTLLGAGGVVAAHKSINQ